MGLLAVSITDEKINRLQPNRESGCQHPIHLGGRFTQVAKSNQLVDNNSEETFKNRLVWLTEESYLLNERQTRPADPFGKATHGSLLSLKPTFSSLANYLNLARYLASGKLFLELSEKLLISRV